jgi:hypothetical protein
MQPFRAVPSPSQLDVRKSTNYDNEWTIAEDMGTFEEGKYIYYRGHLLDRHNQPGGKINSLESESWIQLVTVSLLFIGSGINNRVPESVSMAYDVQTPPHLQSYGFKSGSKRTAEEFEGPYGASSAYPNKKLRASSDFINPQQINYEATVRLLSI